MGARVEKSSEIVVDNGVAKSEYTLQIHAAATYELPADTCALLMVEPPQVGATYTMLHQELFTTPTQASELWTDSDGNIVRRLLAPAGPFQFEYRAQVRVPANTAVPDDAVLVAPMELPLETWPYLRPSRYCPSDRLERLAQSLCGNIVTGGGQVNAIANWVRTHIEYQYGTSDAHTSALDTLIERVGVCRDFAHVTIALCRALGIPARYISGYALGLTPCDFHGYVQVYVGSAWYNVDSTFAGVRPALVPIAVGRDAADVAMLTTTGPATVREQIVEVLEVEG